jgi:CBS domain-containing protein
MKQVKDIMTATPACCLRETNLRDVAQLMVDNNCGIIPVINNDQEKILLGVLTDRDIACRLVAKGINPLEKTAADCLTSPAIAVELKSSLEECADVLKANKIRRVPVLDKNDQCCGIISQADIAAALDDAAAGRILKQVSESSEGPSLQQ